MDKTRCLVRLGGYLIGLILLCSCGTSQPYYKSGTNFNADSLKSKQIEHSVLLIGDTGAPELDDAAQVLQTLRYHLKQGGGSSSVVFLGDNLYPDGMPPQRDHPLRSTSEDKLKPALNMLRSYEGTSFFIPGNHDWSYGTEGLREQEQFIEQYPETTARFVPDNGCPGPSSHNLGNNWQLIVLDSDWWITHSSYPGTKVTDCLQNTRTEVIRKLSDLIEEHDDKKILLAFHHSLHSNGNHGGYFSLKDHIFPLTNLNKYAWLPLPLAGSLYPIVRRAGKFTQDQGDAGYSEFRRRILEATEDKEHVFFAAGHEHSLSFYEKEKANTAKEGKDFFILSGAGSKKSYARKAYGAEFVYSKKGFAKLVSYTDGSVSVEFWVPHHDNKNGRLVYRKQLLEPDKMETKAKDLEERRDELLLQRDSVYIAAEPGYAADGFKRFFWGDHYRDAWTQNVAAPVLDLSTEKGGLDIISKTGGVQTVTLIAEDTTGRRYVMRSVRKDPTQSLPEPLQETIAAEIAHDQTSATHPYGGTIAAELAEAAGVYHTTPELRYIPGTSAFDQKFGEGEGTLVMMEAFVSRDWFNRTYGQQAINMLDSEELWKRMRRGSAAAIDERQLVRSRLFDMYIGDWDRHEKQWFWAETPTDTTATYQPIPIDRDNAFYRSDGVIMGLTRRYFMPKFQNFGDDVDNVKGMNLNAMHFDRWFVNRLNREEWLAIARELQQALTDSAIMAAVAQWPETIRKLNGDTFVEKLKVRRARIPDFAGRYYDLLMREVNVYGSIDREEFVVERKNGGETSVRMYRVDDTGKKTSLYHRIFKASETNEIRLYGFDGNDRFLIAGQSDEPTLIRIIGGGGKDFIQDRSKEAAGRTLFYDTKDGSTIESETVINDKRSTNPAVNRYDKRGFAYDLTLPAITTGYNSTDGIFIGGGAVARTQSFRKHPFAAKHNIRAKIATQSTAFRLSYDGILTEEVSNFDVEFAAKVVASNSSAKYFGLGNETEKEVNATDFYSYRMDHVNLQAGLAKTLADLVTVRGRLGAEYYKPFEKDESFVTSPAAGLNEEAFGPRFHATVDAGFSIDATDRPFRPAYGTIFNFLSELKVGLNEESSTFGRISSDLSMYYTFRKITSTIASRTGFRTNIGDFPFFQANSIGETDFSESSGGVRGFLRNRFAGRTALFQNFELRSKLFYIDSYIMPGSLGTLAFFDTGRVWADRESSSRWHIGYGGGIWFSPLDLFTLRGTIAFSEEETLLTAGAGFTF